mmetsp:Transcript_4366/g.6736  ORF Transcript_4366/g.6736 Transcript_4366/m.6736 type:complete len:235 (-) Transcript_4366:500-1204(-)
MKSPAPSSLAVLLATVQKVRSTFPPNKSIPVPRVPLLPITSTLVASSDPLSIVIPTPYPPTQLRMVVLVKTKSPSLSTSAPWPEVADQYMEGIFTRSNASGGVAIHVSMVTLAKVTDLRAKVMLQPVTAVPLMNRVDETISSSPYKACTSAETGARFRWNSECIIRRAPEAPSCCESRAMMFTAPPPTPAWFWMNRVPSISACRTSTDMAPPMVMAEFFKKVVPPVTVSLLLLA